MATIKQTVFMKYRAQEAGVPFNWDKAKKLDDEGVDKFLKECKEALKVKQEVKTEVVTAKKQPVSPIRLGLACKLALPRFEGLLKDIDSKEFNTAVQKIYDLMQGAEVAMTEQYGAQ